MTEGISWMDHDETDDRRQRLLITIVLAASIVGGGIDLLLDAPDNWLSFHVMYEVTLIAAAAAVSSFLWRGWYRSRHSLSEMRRTLEANAAERDAWRESARHALAGLGQAIDERFGAWHLTPAEREVGLMLLKGRSHKQIAFSTGRSERTVRQHAVGVYEKSGLAGRAELAAFFLEDLMLPRPVAAGDERPAAP
jgi:DNA-binding NarL/FixJ family response regulator